MMPAQAATMMPACGKWRPAGNFTALKGTAELFPRSGQEANAGAKSGLKSAVEMHEKLSRGPLAGLRTGLLHGRLDADEKEIIMRRFQRGEIVRMGHRLRVPSIQRPTMPSTGLLAFAYIFRGMRPD